MPLGILPLKPPLGAVEIFAGQQRSGATTALVFHAAALVITLVTHRQALGRHGRKIDHRRKIGESHAVRANVWRPDAPAPGCVRPARRAVDAEAAVL
ncbi:MAG: hypothetical protein H8E53_10410 [Planctomycetes bacterium]|nr:hypothetical protein [Planctomycetota bacterium]